MCGIDWTIAISINLYKYMYIIKQNILNDKNLIIIIYFQPIIERIYDVAREKSNNSERNRTTPGFEAN